MRVPPRRGLGDASRAGTPRLRRVPPRLTESDVAERYEGARPTAEGAIEALGYEGLLERKTHKTARS